MTDQPVEERYLPGPDPDMFDEPEVIRQDVPPDLPDEDLSPPEDGLGRPLAPGDETVEGRDQAAVRATTSSPSGL
jgi:hypothetical protein